MSALIQTLFQVITTTTNSTSPVQLNPLQLYLTGQLWELDFLMIIPFAWIAWTKFLRNGFLLHFVIEEGEALREIQSKWFVPLDKEGQHLNLNLGGRNVKRGTKFTVFIDGRKVLFTDRFNKRHLIYPVNNVFAFHPFADEVILPSVAKEIVKNIPKDTKSKIEGMLSKFGYAKTSNDKKDESTTIEIEKTELNHITPVKINLVNTIRFDAIKLFKYFFGEAMIARVEASRKQNKPDKMTYIMGALIGALFVFAIFEAAPTLFGLQHIIPTISTTTTSTTTRITTSIAKTSQSFINGTG